MSVQAVPTLLNAPLLTGTTYGFDLASGKKLWEVPIDKLGLTLDQPRDLPLLVFASRVYERGGAPGANESYMSIMCLDTRNGRILHQETLKGAITLVELAAIPDEKTVELKLMRYSVRMKFTDDPDVAPPEKPAAAPAPPEPAADSPVEEKG
jgi:outer membrane protein assembly factor BamB